MGILASCSVKGLPAACRNQRRGRLLAEIVQGLSKQDTPVDAVVLSGGYFVEENQGCDYLDRSFRQRRDLLFQAPFAEDAMTAAKQLDKRRKGALLIFGADTRGPKHPMGDQLCVAWSADGPVGVGRKVFPTKTEGICGYVVNVDDFGAEERVVRIGKTRVLLCSCYDGYGIFNRPDKSKFIRKVFFAGRSLRRGQREFRDALTDGLERWRRLVESTDAAAIAIHRFGGNGKPFSTNYWRRHGISTASAEMRGGWIVAGANFHAALPRRGVDILAAQNVCCGYLSLGNGRTTADAKPICDYVGGNDEVRIRLFDFGSSQRS